MASVPDRDQPGRTRRFVEGAHPFFWLLSLLLALAALVAAVAKERAPAYALNSEWVYRLFVGLAFFLGIYALVLLLWLAYHGKSVQKAQLPGGVGVELADPDLDAAAEGLSAYKDKTDARLKALEKSIEVLKEH